jgi:hypothetical protein
LSEKTQTSTGQMTEMLEAGSAQFLKQALERTPHLGTWTKLYATSQILLAAMGEKRVIPALVEICSNLLACEELAIIEIDRRTKTVRFLGQEGLSSELREVLVQNPEFLESRMERGNTGLSWEGNGPDYELDIPGINALVPLWADQHSSAAMFLFQLLPQRSNFDAEDREVLQLLSLYAGPCLRSQLRG